jgi:hypothetical protein
MKSIPILIGADRDALQLHFHRADAIVEDQLLESLLMRPFHEWTWDFLGQLMH